MKNAPLSLVCTVPLALSCFTPAGACQGAPSPVDLEWLREECEDGALVHHADGRLYLTELSTGVSEFLANGNQPEFSPDGARIAWVDGTRIKGRLRRGDPTIYVIAKDVEPAGGVHWLSDSELAVILRRNGRKGWYRVGLRGAEAEIPELTRLGTGGYECDVKVGEDGVWSYVAKLNWKTSDGKSGRVPGTCSVSLSPDGRTVTSLHNPHKQCDLTAIREGGIDRTILWPFDDGYDNHRFASSDPRFIVAVDEGAETMVVMTIDGERYTRVGTLGHADGGMYGDWTSEEGRAEAWLPPEPERQSGGDAEWPRRDEDAVFLWDHGEASNTLASRAAELSLCRLVTQGEARHGGAFELLLASGSARAEPELAEAAARDLERTGAGSLELVLGAGEVPADGTIVAFGGAEPFLELTQRGSELLFGLAGVELSLGEAAPDSPEHVVLTWTGGALVAYRGGREVSRTSLRGGPISDGGGGGIGLTFGARPDGSRDWSGWVEGIALYRVPLDADDVVANHAHRKRRLAERVSVPRWSVEGVLVRKRPLPRPDLYPQTLVAYDYVIAPDEPEAPFRGHEEVSVVHWGVLDGRVQHRVRDRDEARTYRLELEPWGDHPELHRFKLVADEEVEEVGWFDVMPPSSDAELR